MTDLRCEKIARTALGPPAKQKGPELLWRCPNHDDHDPSLAVNDRKNCWMCGPCGAAGNAWQLAAFLAGESPDNKPVVSAWLRERGLLSGAGGISEGTSCSQERHVADYLYADGKLRKRRFERIVNGQRKKDFVWQHLDTTGKWQNGADGIDPGLYRWDEVSAAEDILLLEGELCVDAAIRLGFPATCGPHGSNRFEPSHAALFKGKRPSILGDNDQPGLTYGRLQARCLVEAGAQSVKFVEKLPGVGDGGDIADWIALGGTREQLLEIITRVPELKPEDVAAWGEVKPTPDKPKPGEAAKLRAVSLGEFLALEIPPREMFLSPVIAAQSLNMLYGFRGIGKTHIVLAMALAVAGGTQFLQWEAPKPRRVLYIDGELPVNLLQQWTAEVVAEGSSQAPAENLSFITPDLQETGLPDLATTLGQAAIAEHCEWADLIILDNLSSLVRAGRENESESWLPVQAWALDLRRRGKSVLFVHHAARSGQNQRGTSKREDLLDTIIGLRRPAAYSPAEGLRAEIHFEKCRAFYGKGAEPFEVALVNNGGGLPTWTVAAIQASQFERARPLLEAGGDIAVLMDELKVSRATAFRLKKKYKESQSQPPVD